MDLAMAGLGGGWWERGRERHCRFMMWTVYIAGLIDSLLSH